MVCTTFAKQATAFNQSLVRYGRFPTISSIRRTSSGSQDYKVDDTIQDYKIEKIDFIKELNIRPYYLKHESTGAEHLHVHKHGNSNNVFSVSLRTTPKNSRFKVQQARSLKTSTLNPPNLPVDRESETKLGKVAIFQGKRFPDFESTYRKRGTGGRSSFNGITATVFNGNGLVSKSLIARLGRSGTQIVIGYRGSRYDDEKMRPAGDLGQIYFSHYHMKDEQSLHNAMKYSNVVINTTGKIQETKNFPFNEVHVEGPRRMARIARELGVKKFIHFSAMNANPNPTPWCLKNGSQFLKSKYHGELAVREEFPDAIIFRPADILGEADDFLNHFTMMLRCRYTRKLPIWDYYDGVEKQPVWIKDVISGVEKAILDDGANGKTFQAVGPYRYCFYDLIEYMRACSGMGQVYDDCAITNLRWDLGVRFLIAYATKFQKYPFCNWERVERDCHSDYIDPNLPTLKDLGVELTPLEHQIKILGYYRPREHRVEIPFESAMNIELPKKLNVVS